MCNHYVKFFCVVCLVFGFCFGSISSDTQRLLLALHSEINISGLRDPKGCRGLNQDLPCAKQESSPLYYSSTLGFDLELYWWCSRITPGYAPMHSLFTPGSHGTHMEC